MRKKQGRKPKIIKSQNRVGAPDGSKNALKFRTPEERQHVFKLYCEHLKEGLTPHCFPSASKATMDGYMQKYPDDMPADKKEQAEREGRLWWENLGKVGTAGLRKGFNAKSYAFIMMNKYSMREHFNVDGKIDSDVSVAHSIVKLIMPDNGRDMPDDDE